jgi:metal-responsive CopG/Arc/MetJ family transcriptional regulator
MTSDSTKVISLRLPADLVEKVDGRAKPLGISRNQWFENMTSWCLENTATIKERGGKP